MFMHRPCLCRATHCLTANIRMPDFGLKFHNWRPERVIGGDLDVNLISTTFVWSIWRTWEDSSQVCHIILAADGLRRDLRVGIGMDISQFLGNAPSPVASHNVLRAWIKSHVSAIKQEVK